MRPNIRFGLLALALVVGLALGYGAALVRSPTLQEIRNAHLEVGDRAPDFRLPDHTGGFFQLSDLEGRRSVVLAFYPLAWTPV